jgi:dihydroorotase
MPEQPALVLKGGTVLDQSGERRADVAIAGDGTIAAIGEDLDGTSVLDCGGCTVVPGFVDLHTHLREPGREDAETIETGSRAAALGGFTAVVAMPNTDPAIDNAGMVREVLALGEGALVEVHPSGAITVGRGGERLAPMAEMAALGVRLFTDDGSGVQDDGLMRRALEYAGGIPVPGGVTLAQHCEIESLARGGHMHEGAWSSRLGLPGIPAEAEELMVQRDIALAQLTGVGVHFQHLSTVGSVELVRAAKARGVRVTAEATPHHCVLTDELVAGYDPTFKVNPPLRTGDDTAAVRAGLADGTIDAIATDHAPHTQETKELPFDQGPPGMLGLEVALAVALTEAGLTLAQAIALLSWQPAVIARLEAAHGGPIEAGRPANLAVIDPAAEWTVDAERSASRSRNNPWHGRRLRGQVRHTVLRGEVVVLDAEAQR